MVEMTALVEARSRFFSDCPLVVRAPGSFYWAGEHAVVYGQLAVQQPIPLYAYVGVAPNGAKTDRFCLRFVRRDADVAFEPMRPNLLEEVDDALPDDEDEEDDSMGGYYSRN